jgi:hypothetical protein
VHAAQVGRVLTVATLQTSPDSAVGSVSAVMDRHPQTVLIALLTHIPTTLGTAFAPKTG